MAESISRRINNLDMSEGQPLLLSVKGLNVLPSQAIVSKDPFIKAQSVTLRPPQLPAQHTLAVLDAVTAEEIEVKRPRVLYERPVTVPQKKEKISVQEVFKNKVQPPRKQVESTLKIKPYMMMTDTPTYNMRREMKQERQQVASDLHKDRLKNQRHKTAKPFIKKDKCVKQQQSVNIRSDYLRKDSVKQNPLQNFDRLEQTRARNLMKRPLSSRVFTQIPKQGKASQMYQEKYREARFENLLPTWLFECMRDIFEVTDVYADGIVSRLYFVQNLQESPIVTGQYGKAAVGMSWPSSKKLSFEQVIYEIMKDLQFDQKNHPAHYLQFITWPEFAHYFENYREFNERWQYFNLRFDTIPKQTPPDFAMRLLDLNEDDPPMAAIEEIFFKFEQNYGEFIPRHQVISAIWGEAGLQDYLQQPAIQTCEEMLSLAQLLQEMLGDLEYEATMFPNDEHQRMQFLTLYDFYGYLNEFRDGEDRRRMMDRVRSTKTKREQEYIMNLREEQFTDRTVPPSPIPQIDTRRSLVRGSQEELDYIMMIQEGESPGQTYRERIQATMEQAVSKAQPAVKKHPREVRHDELTAESLGLLNLMKECDMMEIFALS